MNVRVMQLVRAVRGPLVLIALGALFTIDHFGGIRFERTWPVLIIVIGVWKLLEYIVGRPGVPGQPPLGGVQP